MLEIKASRGDVKAQEIIAKREDLFQPFADEVMAFHRGKQGTGEDSTMFNIVSKKGAEELDRQQEVSFRTDNLIIAQELEKTDKTPQEIKLLTGWEKVNSEWIYEIPDFKSCNSVQYFWFLTCFLKVFN